MTNFTRFFWMLSIAVLVGGNITLALMYGPEPSTEVALLTPGLESKDNPNTGKQSTVVKGGVTGDGSKKDGGTIPPPMPMVTPTPTRPPVPVDVLIVRIDSELLRDTKRDWGAMLSRAVETFKGKSPQLTVEELEVKRPDEEQKPYKATELDRALKQTEQVLAARLDRLEQGRVKVVICWISSSNPDVALDASVVAAAQTLRYPRAVVQSRLIWSGTPSGDQCEYLSRVMGGSGCYQALDNSPTGLAGAVEEFAK